MAPADVCGTVVDHRRVLANHIIRVPRLPRSCSCPPPPGAPPCAVNRGASRTRDRTRDADSKSNLAARIRHFPPLERPRKCRICAARFDINPLTEPLAMIVAAPSHMPKIFAAHGLDAQRREIDSPSFGTIPSSSVATLLAIQTDRGTRGRGWRNTKARVSLSGSHALVFLESSAAWRQGCRIAHLMI